MKEIAVAVLSGVMVCLVGLFFLLFFIVAIVVGVVSWLSEIFAKMLSSCLPNMESSPKHTVAANRGIGG